MFPRFFHNSNFLWKNSFKLPLFPSSVTTEENTKGLPHSSNPWAYLTTLLHHIHRNKTALPNGVTDILLRLVLHSFTMWASHLPFGLMHSKPLLISLIDYLLLFLIIKLLSNRFMVPNPTTPNSNHLGVFVTRGFAHTQTPNLNLVPNRVFSWVTRLRNQLINAFICPHNVSITLVM